MRLTVTVLSVLAFLLVVYGLRTLLRQVNDEDLWAARSLSVASGNPPPEYEAYAKWQLMDPGEQAQIESALQAEHSAAGSSTRLNGAKIALVGAVLALAASVLPVWWR